MNSKVRRTLLHHEALISDIRWKYKNARKEQGKKTVSEVVVGKIVKKYRLQRWSETALGFSKKRRTLSERKAYNRYTDKSLVSKVRAFFSRDDACRMTTGKKQTITKKKMQKRFLVDTMKNLQEVSGRKQHQPHFLCLILPAATLLCCPPLPFRP